MLPSLKIGRFFGIPVYLHSTLLLLPAVVMFTSPGSGGASLLLKLASILSVFLCVLLHEFGHALMARWFGITTRDVTLYPIGGVARLERMTEKPGEEILIALAGPAVNVVIAALLTPLVLTLAMLGVRTGELLKVAFDDPPSMWLANYLLFLWGANITLVVFNLIPAFPMDGGRVFRAILAYFFGFLRGTEIAVVVGIGVAMTLAVGATLVTLSLEGTFNPMLLVIAAFVALVGPMELRALRYRERQKQDALRQQTDSTNEPLPYTPLPYPDEDETDSPPPPTPEMQPGFSGYTWDREFGVWIKWQNGRRVAAYWNGPE